jgi:hypothetical protein
LEGNLNFTQEIEQHITINYLDLTIHKTPTNVKISIYTKPTFTDTIVSYTSNHPTQHKYAAVRFLYNHLNTYQLHTAEYLHEENISFIFLHNYAFPILPQKPLPLPPPHPKEQPTKRTWATLTYTGRETHIHHETIQTHELKNSLPHK